MNKNLERINPSGIRKFFDLVMNSRDVISLGVGEPDFTTPWHIREGAIFSLEEGRTTYTSNAGMIGLREMLSAKIAKDNRAVYCPNDEILVTVGVSEGFDLALRAILNIGDEVIIPEPCFVSYKPLTILANAVPVVIKTDEEHNFEASPGAIREKITDKTKAIILNSPNNPTGAVIKRKAMEEIADIAVEHGIYVISDEIYSELVYEGKHASFSSLNGMKEHTILLNGFSKSYAMTGLRIGYAAAPAEIIFAMNKIHQYSIMCASTTSQVAAIEALKNGESETIKMRNEYDRRRRFIVKGLNDSGLNCTMPKGAFYAFPSIKKTGLSSEEFCGRLLKEENVAVIPGNVFGSCGEGFARCSFAASMEDIKESLERIKRFVGKCTAN